MTTIVRTIMMKMFMMTIMITKTRMLMMILEVHDVQYSWVLYFPKVKISRNPSRIVLEETDLRKMIVIPDPYPREMTSVIKVASSGRRYAPHCGVRK